MFFASSILKEDKTTRQQYTVSCEEQKSTKESEKSRTEADQTRGYWAERRKCLVAGTVSKLSGQIPSIQQQKKMKINCKNREPFKGIK